MLINQVLITVYLVIWLDVENIHQLHRNSSVMECTAFVNCFFLNIILTCCMYMYLNKSLSEILLFFSLVPAFKRSQPRLKKVKTGRPL